MKNSSFMQHSHIYMITAGIICTLLISCQSKKAEEPAKFEPATYTGVIPCADCEGIAYRLSIEEDNRFAASSVYIGESNQKFSENGSWSVRNNTLLVLKHDNGKNKKFRIEEGRLIMLDREGKTINGSLAQMYTLDKVEENQSSNP